MNLLQQLSSALDLPVALYMFTCPSRIHKHTHTHTNTHTYTHTQHTHKQHTHTTPIHSNRLAPYHHPSNGEHDSMNGVCDDLQNVDLGGTSPSNKHQHNSAKPPEQQLPHVRAGQPLSNHHMREQQHSLPPQQIEEHDSIGAHPLPLHTSAKTHQGHQHALFSRFNNATSMLQKMAAHAATHVVSDVI